MKITMYELIGLVKDGKASDITTNFMFDRKKYNLLAFLDEYTLDINSLNWEIEILEEEKKIPEKIKLYTLSNNDSADFTTLQDFNNKDIQRVINWILDYLKNKGE
jgi:hypothetical protein